MAGKVAKMEIQSRHRGFWGETSFEMCTCKIEKDTENKHYMGVLGRQTVRTGRLRYTYPRT